MFYADVVGSVRAPSKRGERARCPLCKGIVVSVMPENATRHWRHLAGECDNWSETETVWHLNWKEEFKPEFREVALLDSGTGKGHRADILIRTREASGTVLELQHSYISEQERDLQETFYLRSHKLFWLIHLHDDGAFLATSFRLSLQSSRRREVIRGKTFYVQPWIARTQAWINKWRRARGHVFFDLDGRIYYLASDRLLETSKLKLGTSEFAIHHVSRDNFIKAVLASQPA